MGLFQLFEHIVWRVIPDVVIIDRHIQNLMENRMNIINGRRLQMAFVCKVIIEPLYICFSQRRYSLWTYLMTDKGLIHILIVFKGVVFQTSLQILPKLINVIDRCVSSFCLNAIALVFCDLFLFVSQFIKCLGIHITPFVVGVRPTEMVCTIGSLWFACTKHYSWFVFSFCSWHNFFLP